MTALPELMVMPLLELEVSPCRVAMSEPEASQSRASAAMVEPEASPSQAVGMAE